MEGSDRCALDSWTAGFALVRMAESSQVFETEAKEVSMVNGRRFQRAVTFATDECRAEMTHGLL